MIGRPPVTAVVAPETWLVTERAPQNGPILLSCGTAATRSASWYR
nr:hypothetical protein [uncultured Bosea sp.]